MKRDRLFALNREQFGEGPVIYWMSRDQRAHDNWALIFAREMAADRGRPLGVVFCLVPEYLGAGRRQYAFMLEGLREVEGDLRDLGIPFFLLRGAPAEEVPRFLSDHKAAALFTDFDPLRVKRRWRDEVAGKCRIPVFEVDAHNVVPCRKASNKKEYAAYTLRPKVHRLLSQFLDDFPTGLDQPFPWEGNLPSVDWEETFRFCGCRRSDLPEGCAPGSRGALKRLEAFLTQGLTHFDSHRNDPMTDGQSGLSPWLHFGHLAPQRAAMAALEAAPETEGTKAFIEELVVRRELSDNFCFYEENYDSVKSFPDWAKKTLDEHRKDAREYVYSVEEFEGAGTHDALWNAAQKEMMKTGKMHGYMRMYWAKKILEWSPSPEEAMETAILLNDRYELDGRDPNGYAGVAWSIGGVHDRAWPERPVYGKVRYMNAAGCRRKFDVDAYIGRFVP
ncbi:MAG: deoxyribodipyrimidine photo-lyase [Thermovirgaceae bacterium]